MGCIISINQCCKHNKDDNEIKIDYTTRPVDGLVDLKHWQKALNIMPYSEIKLEKSVIENKLLNFLLLRKENKEQSPLWTNKEWIDDEYFLNFLVYRNYFENILNLTLEQRQFSLTEIRRVPYINIAKYLYIISSKYFLKDYFSDTDKFIPYNNYYVYSQYGTSCTANAVSFAWNYMNAKATGKSNLYPSRDYIWYYAQQLTGQSHTTLTVGTSLVQAVIATTLPESKSADDLKEILNPSGFGVCDETLSFNQHPSPDFNYNQITTVDGMHYYYPSTKPLGGNLPVPTIEEKKQGRFNYTTRYKAVPMKGDKTDIVKIKWILFCDIPFLLRFGMYRNFYNQLGNSEVLILPDRDYATETSNQIGWHSVNIIGWDNNKIINSDNGCCSSRINIGAFLCRNSWGPTSGINGHFWIPFDYFTTGFNDAFGQSLITECIIIESVHKNRSFITVDRTDDVRSIELLNIR